MNRRFRLAKKLEFHSEGEDADRRGSWTPGMVNPKPNDPAYQRRCDAQNLCNNIKRPDTDVERFAPIHGRVDTWEHFLEYLGKPPEQAAKDQKPGN